MRLLSAVIELDCPRVGQFYRSRARIFFEFFKSSAEDNGHATSASHFGFVADRKTFTRGWLYPAGADLYTSSAYGRIPGAPANVAQHASGVGTSWTRGGNFTSGEVKYGAVVYF